MVTRLMQWWQKLGVKQKDLLVILLLSAPLILALCGNVALIRKLLFIQEQGKEVLLARDHVRLLNRLAVDIEDSFRGYLLTKQEVFLEPMEDAASKLEPVVAETLRFVALLPAVTEDIRETSEQLRVLLRSKRSLIEKIHNGQQQQVLAYVRSTKGLAQSNAIRHKYRRIEDELTQRLRAFDGREAQVTQSIYWAVLFTAVLAVVFGLLGARLLRRSLSGPLAILDASITRLGENTDARVVGIPITSTDEIGHIARSFEKSAQRIQGHVKELEAINAISKEINSVETGGVAGVLKLITDRAAQMLGIDLCLLMLRHEQMQCWVVEAASGDWHRTLRKSVMLWEQFPTAVKAFVDRVPVVETEVGNDIDQELAHRTIKAESVLAIPLIANNEAFGVLLLLTRKVSDRTWNVRLAQAFAEVAAIAIGNARLYDAAKSKGEGLESRLRQLEHTAQMLAHDLKAPGERMEVLATMLLEEYRERLDERATRWLTLMRQNGQALTEHVENILELAQVGSVHEGIEAVDPALVIDAVLKERRDELHAQNVRVQMAITVPKVPCHRAYLRQVFDNLISNAIKFTVAQSMPHIRITAKRHGNMIHFSVSDNGPGIPAGDRDRVFTPFVRLDAGIKGSGIGLAIVRRIVEFYGGRIWIETSDMQGCKVSFILPVLSDLPYTVGDAAAHDTHPEQEDFGTPGDQHATRSS